MLQNKLCWD